MGAASPAISGYAITASPQPSTSIPKEMMSRLRVAAKFWARQFATKTTPHDDLLQEGLYAALVAVREYRPGGPATIETFAIACIKNRMVDFIRREKRNARPLISGDTIHGDDSEESFFDTIAGNGKSQLEAVCANDLSRQAILAVSNLPARERHCVEGYFLRSTDHSTLARELGISRSRVIQLIKAGLRKLRNALLCLPLQSSGKMKFLSDSKDAQK